MLRTRAVRSLSLFAEVSRVLSSFYTVEATPHIVRGRVIHFLPDAAQLFINCCSRGRIVAAAAACFPPYPRPL